MKKKILFISTDSFNYSTYITRELQNQGWEVTFLNDRPSNSTIMKILIRKFKFFISGYLDYYYLNHIKDFGVFDHVLIVKGEAVSNKVIDQIRKNHLNGKIVLYYWDSICNFIGGVEKAKSADLVYSFDPKDCKLYGFTHLPLFYIKTNLRGNDSKSNNQWDISFIGTAHTDRLKVITKVRNQLVGPMYIFIYFQSKLIYFFYKITNPYFKFFAKEELSLKAIEKNFTTNIYMRSKAILDIEHINQTGLTMRTLEVLSLGKKLITTNQSIKNYPFFDESIIYILDRHKPVIDLNFLESKVVTNIESKIKRYEISNWIKQLTNAKISDG